MRSHPAVWLVPAGLLFVASLPLPYGFYTFLRFVVCGAAAYLAFHEYGVRESVTAWAIGLGVIAVLFNLLIPVYLSREVWAPIDLVAAFTLIAHWRFGTRPSAE